MTDEAYIPRSRLLRMLVPTACLLSTVAGVCIGHGLWGPGGVLR